jgi:uncharacterized protein
MCLGQPILHANRSLSNAIQLQFLKMITLYDAPLSLFIRHLNILSHFLEKGEEYAKETGIDVDEVAEWKLIEDMKPLSFQIWSACTTTKNTLSFFGLEMPPGIYDERTMDDLHKRLAITIELLEKVDRKAVEGKEEEPVHIPAGTGVLDFTAQQAVLKFGVPNFYFHCAMAYAILRAKGVPVGKNDWLKGGQEWSEILD